MKKLPVEKKIRKARAEYIKVGSNVRLHIERTFSEITWDNNRCHHIIRHI